MSIKQHHRGGDYGRGDDPHGVTKSSWQNGFVGTYHGNMGEDAWFSAEATQGGVSDGLSAKWKGDKSQVGRRMAVLPSFSKVTEGAHVVDLTDASESFASQYSHLPGFRTK